MLAPQDLPSESRGNLMARLFAKYRVISATIRVESAVSTAAGGQYACFFDPNPSNNWVANNALSALTSMPVQDTAAAWECLKLPIPASELERNFELYTQSATVENLVTRFGQVVLLNLAVSNTTPAGSAQVTVWLDATWEFYEPNATAESKQVTIYFQPGSWTVAGGGVITPTTYAPGPTSSGAWRLFPGISGTIFATEQTGDWLGYWQPSSTPGNFICFATEADAIQYGTTGIFTNALLPSATPTVVMPAVIGTPILLPTVSVSYPYKAVKNI